MADAYKSGQTYKQGDVVSSPERPKGGLSAGYFWRAQRKTKGVWVVCKTPTANTEEVIKSSLADVLRYLGKASKQGITDGVLNAFAEVKARIAKWETEALPEIIKAREARLAEREAELERERTAIRELKAKAKGKA